MWNQFSVHVVKKIKILLSKFRIIQTLTQNYCYMNNMLHFDRHPSLSSCLRAIRELQKNGHIPSDPSLFKSYAEYGHFVDVRVAALEALVDYTRGKLFTLIENSPLNMADFFL